MLTVISPAKTLDFERPIKARDFSEPAFLGDSAKLVKQLRTLAPDAIGELMRVSPAIAELNHARFLSWKTPFTAENARQALFVFQGDVYQGLAADQWKAADLRYAQRRLRILSGLYGLLRPLDLMQPYRLEMGTRLPNARGKDLYAFWGERLTLALNEALAAQGDEVLVNLASVEYFKAVRPRQLQARVVTPVFKDLKNGQYKVISFFAKRARGQMAAWIVRNRARRVEELEGFDLAGYRFDPARSKLDELVFTRDAAPQPST